MIYFILLFAITVLPQLITIAAATTNRMYARNWIYYSVNIVVLTLLYKALGLFKLIQPIAIPFLITMAILLVAASVIAFRQK